jgi:hypothetical protein
MGVEAIGLISRALQRLGFARSTLPIYWTERLAKRHCLFRLVGQGVPTGCGLGEALLRGLVLGGFSRLQALLGAPPIFSRVRSDHELDPLSRGSGWRELHDSRTLDRPESSISAPVLYGTEQRRLLARFPFGLRLLGPPLPNPAAGGEYPK